MVLESCRTEKVDLSRFGPGYGTLV